MRLIDADDFSRSLIEHMIAPFEYNDYDKGLYDASLLLKNAPTIEPERKKGKWVTPSREGCFSFSNAYAECSICKKKTYMGWRMNFCPNCGADMRGESDE